jgi:CelD/BcsL family acetyltransferase involved in cellulose biosynthesis
LTAQLTFEIVSDPAAFAALESEWVALSERAYGDHVFQTYDWALSGWECVASPRGRSLKIIVGRGQGRAVLIWPLAAYKSTFVTIAHGLDSETTEYREIVVEDSPEHEGWVAQAWEFATKSCGLDALYLQYVPDDGPLGAQLRKVGCAVAVEEPTQYLDQNEFEDWDAYYRTRGKNTKSDLRRRRRRLDETGTVTVATIADPDELEEFVTWVYETKVSALESVDGHTGWFTTAEHLKFLTAAASRGLVSGVTAATALKVDDQIVAGKLDLDYKNGKTLLITTYNPKWSRYSPGQLLYQKSIQESFADGKSKIDFRIGHEAHKERWTNANGMVREFWVPCSFLGRLYVAWRNSPIRSALRDMARRASRG